MVSCGRRPLLRALAGVWGVLQLILPLAVTFADARSEAASVGNISHVESTSSAACKPAHGDDCALCRFLSTANGQTPCRPSFRAVVRKAPAPKSVEIARRAVAGRELPPSRAPPRS
jgi:hypothetical protein